MTTQEAKTAVERVQDILVNKIGDTSDLNAVAGKRILPHGPGLNLTPKHWAQSDVSMRRDEVMIGTGLVYSDQCNYSKFIVTELIEGGFKAEDVEDGYEEIKFFDNLQLGWRFN